MTHFCSAAAIALTLLLALFASAAPAHATKRLAFVIGIDRYDNLTNDQQLKRAVADARAMTATFKDLQFNVIGGDNVSREQFLVYWQGFLDAISPGDTAAVFFAGHGIEVEGSNYLMPRDVPAAAKGERVLRSSAVALTEVLLDLDKRKPGTAFVVLDACRNNPFSVSGRSIGGARVLGWRSGWGR